MFYVQQEKDGMLYAVTMDELNKQSNKAIENKQYIKKTHESLESNKIIACPLCGADNTSNTIYCTKCGAKQEIGETEDSELTELHLTIVEALANGKSHDDIVKVLIDNKMDKSTADMLVSIAAKDVDEFILQPSWRRKKRNDGIKKMIIGFIFFGLGTAATVINLNSTTQSTAIIYWGAILFGFIDLVIGLYQTLKYLD
jgi:transcription elongation factor Elf1